MKSIDINCDLGEGMATDEHIMSFISSCNIACGGHYGDGNSVRTALQLALSHGVKAGAHPSFEDQENFGRVFRDISRSRFRESVTQQMQLFTQTAQEVGVELHHIKMHGALYHATAYREDFSDWLVEWMKEVYSATILYVPPESLLEKKCAKNKIPYMREAFADRHYDAHGKLVARSLPNAMITDYKIAARQIAALVNEQKVTSIAGISHRLEVDTICIHGDNLGLASSLEYLVEQLKTEGIYIA
ncbi:LamB/YcsF family protein [Nonlabens sp.]|uniref:LamB/YcsF family protein n=1 Tax=Nonlabens sp. TaxID=1888209 RepID=UPI0025FDEA46|nr:LamB/YcsF family protein [Nonlabens sp.]